MSALLEASSTTWTIKRLVSSGSTAHIILAVDTDESKEVAVKVFKSEVDSEVVNREADIHGSLSHPNILEMKGICSFTTPRSESKRALVLEYASRCDLLDHIQDYGRLPQAVAHFFFHQMLDALEYLHERAHVSHGDIKPENICIDDQFNIKLTDFGHAKRIGRKELITDIQGTPEYLSPEMHKKESYDPDQSDLFALGITLFAMVAGTLPFESATQEDGLYKLFIEGNLENLEEFWEIHEEMRVENFGFSCPQGFYSKEFRELINRMLAYDSKQRFESISELKKAKWCQKPLLQSKEVQGLMEQISMKKNIKV